MWDSRPSASLWAGCRMFGADCFWGGVYLDLLRAFGPRTADGGCPHMGLMKVLR